MSEKSKIGVAVIACGSRGRYVVNNLLKDSNQNVEIRAVYDPNRETLLKTLDFWKVDPENVNICDDYQAAINTPGVYWVMIFSPNAFHKEHILASFKANKHVFTEKPLATSIDDCKAIFDAHAQTDLLFATGFVLRYAPLYRKTKEILSSGKLGTILSIEGNENITPPHGGYIMANWRRLTRFAGPHILEKCCHDLDLINWFCDSLPTQVSAIAHKRFFVPENKKLEEKYGKELFNNWDDPEKVDTPFNDDSDLMDTFMGYALYRNDIQVSFCATMSNAIPERRMRFNCSEGTLIVELYESKLTYKALNDEAVHVISFGGDGHGGGDSVIMKELYECMTKGVLPKCSGQEGLESAVFALALDQAAREHKIIDLEPTWKALNR